MTAEVAREVLSATASPVQARPVAFDGLFGWLSPGVTRRGVVLCGTLGFEQLSAYRAWRALAEDIAASGCSCLRFDYPGEGDSGDAGAGDVPNLVAAVRRAIRFLREETDAEEIVLVGLRFGGMLAALAAREGGVDRLVLLAPFVSGRAYLREMQLQARNTILWPGGVPLQAEPGTLNVNGFVLSQGLIGDIQALGSDSYREAGVSRVLVVDRSPERLTPAFASASAQVENVPYGRFSELLSGEMNFTPVSEVRRAVEDLNKIVVEFSVDACRASAMNFRLPAPPRGISERGWREETARFGDGLFGILCAPDRDPVRKCCVLFVNSGTYVRSGPARHATRLARNLARRGIPSFRIDPRGTGDSPDHPQGRSLLYNREALEDLKAAIDRLQAYACAPVVLIGFCSGAYAAFHTLCEDERVTDAVLANLYCFDWPAGMPPEEVLGRPTVRSAITYAKSLLSRNTWYRIVTGKISLPAVVSEILKSRVRALARRVASWRGSLRKTLSATERIAGVTRRGGRFVFVYSADDPGILNIEQELGLRVARIGPALGVGLEIIEHCDHGFSTPEAQARIDSILSDLVDRRAGAFASE